MSERYGAARVHASIAHFLLGKAVSSLAGFITIILLVKALPVSEFAAYSVLVSLEDVVTALSGLGLTHAILRYVPELYAQKYRIALRRFVIAAGLSRVTVLVFVGMLAYALSGSIAGSAGLANAVHAYQVFLLLVVLRLSSHFVAQVLESALHQASAQAGYSAAAVGRLGGLLFLMSSGHGVVLVQVIWMEAAAETAGLAVMLAGLARMLVAQGLDAAPAGDAAWGRANLRRILRFALSGYVQHLSITLYATPNRMVGGHYLAPPAMAAYGFCLSLFDYVRRYLPAQLLMGVIRPVIVARYTQTRDFPGAVHTSNLVLKVNAMLIGLVLAYIPVAGEDTVLLLTGGKFGHGTTLLLLALGVFLLMETQRQQLEVLAQAVEQYHLLIPANLLLSASLLPAILAVPALGAVALPLSNMAGLLLANNWVISRLRRKGYAFQHPWEGLSRIAAVAAAAAGAGLSVLYLTQAWWAGGMTVSLAYCALLLTLCRKDIQELHRMARAGNAAPAMEPLAAKTETRPVHIVFGILSSRDSSQAIAQIADCVRPHRVIVHHDYSKYPQFAVLRDNISVIPARAVTAWGGWSLVDATLTLMTEALKDPCCSHFQLLSESCLPVRHIAAFENFLKQHQPDAMIDLIPLDSSDAGALASHGWRYLPRGPLMRRVARRAAMWWQGDIPDYRQQGSVNLHLPGHHAGPAGRLRQAIGRALVTQFHSGPLGAFPMGQIRQCWIGGQWFALSRAMAEHLLAMCDAAPEVARHFSRCHIPDEAFIHTLIAHSGAARIFPGNHVLFWEGDNMGPNLLGPKDIESVCNSGKFFARKLPLDPANPVRQPFLQHSLLLKAGRTAAAAA